MRVCVAAAAASVAVIVGVVGCKIQIFFLLFVLFLCCTFALALIAKEQRVYWVCVILG